MENQLPDFTGKSVVFYATMPPGAPDWLVEGIVLESASFELQNDRVFVVGRTPPQDDDDSESDWNADRQAAIAWDSVYYYVVMTTHEYREARKLQAAGDSALEPEDGSETDGVAKSTRNVLASLSLFLIGVVIPIAIVIALILWIVKMM